MCDDPLEAADTCRIVDEPTADPAIPASIDQYVLLRRLGRGGSGIVFEAEDRSLDRRVAIKLVPHDPDSGVSRHV